jgi:hypothetical protein
VALSREESERRQQAKAEKGQPHVSGAGLFREPTGQTPST